ncbi:MAG: hypothetical protein RIQ54_585 [Candidatus Parcubacteria bacterium]|jgi:type IV pilus assembly protein PilC
MRFKYQAKNKEGELQVGFVEAVTKEAAASILSSHSLFILSIESNEKTHLYDRIASYFSGVGAKDLTVFSRQMATLLEARLPLSSVLKTLYEQTTHPSLKQAIGQVNDDVTAGLSLSQSLERQSDIFSGFFVSMIRSAEVIGNLEEVSGFLADYMEKEYALTIKARSALIYPAIVVFLFLAVAFIMITFVFPQIGPIFEQSGVALPFFTQVLIGSGVFLATWWPLFLILGLLVVIVGLDYFQSSEGRALWDDVKIKLPVVNRVYLPLTMARLCNVMSMLLRGGVPVNQALEISGQTINNVLYRDLFNDISEDVRQGRPLSASIARYPEYFPVLVSQMLVVGEATGQIDKMFSRLGKFYERESDSTISNVVDLIQPVLMIVIGLLVGILFASVLVPLYKLTSAIQ